MKRKKINELNIGFVRQENQCNIAFMAALPWLIAAVGVGGGGYVAYEAFNAVEDLNDENNQLRKEIVDTYSTLPQDEIANLEIFNSDGQIVDYTRLNEAMAGRQEALVTTLEETGNELQETEADLQKAETNLANLQQEVDVVLAQFPEFLEGQSFRGRVELAINTPYIYPTEQEVAYGVRLAISDSNKAQAIIAALEPLIAPYRGGDPDQPDWINKKLNEIKIDDKNLTPDEINAIKAQFAQFESTPTLVDVQAVIDRIKGASKFTVSSGGQNTEVEITADDKSALTKVKTQIENEPVVTNQIIVNAINQNITKPQLKAHVIRQISKVSPLPLRDAIAVQSFRSALEIVRTYVASGNTDNLRTDLEAEIRDPLMVAELVTSAELEIKEEVVDEINEGVPTPQTVEPEETVPPVEPQSNDSGTDDNVRPATIF